jgi:hypothetical protein
MNLTLELDSNQYKDLTRYCELNKFIPEEIAKKSYLEGFMIEKYGLLGNTGGVQEKQVEIEVIREKRVEIPVEVIKEVVKVEYVEVPIEKIVTVEKPVEKLVEVIKEVPVEVIKEVQVEKIVEVIKEVPVEKIVTIYDNSSENELLLKIQQLEQEFSTKTTEIGIIKQEFSTITTENENIFHDKMSKKDEELDELRRSLDEVLDKPPVEIVKEVYIEKQSDNDNSKKLQDTLVKLRQNILDKDSKIVELESKISELMRLQDEKKALYLRGSNLDDKLYK